MALGFVEKPKYQQLVDKLTEDIRSGRYKPGGKLPSEAALVKKFETSRITVGRALRELQIKGLVERVAGSGSYVRGEFIESKPLLFGLLIPDLGETEIFDPICHGIASAPLIADHALLWGHTDERASSKEEQCWKLCQQFIARQVAGVFFAPLEFEAEAVKTNRRIQAALREAKIPVILLDRRPSAAPEREKADLVGLNNRQAGFLATEHLINLGCKRIGFLAQQSSESTVNDRMAGYLDALRIHGLPEPMNSVLEVSEDGDRAEPLENRTLEGFVCVNDRVAGTFMHVFLSQGMRIPGDIRLIGIDDVAYAKLLPVPLTTVRQPTREIGEAAMRMMLERVSQPRMPARELLLDGELIIRKSCGKEIRP
jgi:GntR family transcriptional regulator, arabinose operon transcriptional repressor